MMINRLYIFLILAAIVSCKPDKFQGVPEPVIDAMPDMKFRITLDAEAKPFTWTGETLEPQKLYDMNTILNNDKINPSLKSPCRPPGAGNPTVRYAEHYRCGSTTVLEPSCVLWNDVVPLVNGAYRDSELSADDLKEIMNKAVNYGNMNPPKCRCQKVPSHVYRYNIQSTSYINTELPKKPLTRRLWITTTYNCCGPCA